MASIPESFFPPKELWPEYIIPEEYVIPDRVNLASELLDRNVEMGLGDSAAIYFHDKKTTYNELLDQANRLGNSLLDMGIKPLDRVAIRFVNVPEAIVANFAIMKIGGIPVPMSPLWSRHEISFCCNNAEASALIVSSALLEEVRKAIPEMTGCRHIIVAGDESNIPSGEGLHSFSDLISKGSSRLEPVMMNKGDIGVILYTSGTTGAPKGCVHFIESLLVEAEIVGKHVWKLGPGDVLGGSAPVSFAAGYGTFANIPFRFGAAISLLPKFAAEEMLGLVARHGITVFTGLPTAYRKLLTTPDFDSYDLSSVKIFSTGGDSLGPETYNAWLEKTGKPIYEGLGATEMAHLVTSNMVAPQPNPRSIGLPLPGFQVKITSEEGNECGVGEIGILTVKGPTGMLYWRPYEENERLLNNQRAKVRDGWNLLGDAVYQDKDGYIFFVSREEDMIKSSGYRIGPSEVEEALKKHPAVADAGVIGMPDSLLGQLTKAFIVLKTGFEPSDEIRDEIVQSCRAHIAVYKLPRAVEFVDSLPKTPTGKLIRRLLRDA